MSTCERTWPSDAPVRYPEKNRYRQHRCGRPTHGPHEPCVCRYCGAER